MSGYFNKRKIINDPVYGFLTIPFELVFDIIEHPWFQRLRRIRQLGLTDLVYPGALHTRFHHTLGAVHLTGQAIEELRAKEYLITNEEAEAVTLAILMHDIGHGPFSHALENSIVTGISHEEISLLFMERLNEEFDGKLDLAISVFKDEYPKRFLYQLVSSQLDMDRLDYLRRDSFFTGVSEGVVGSDRIIKMLHVVNDELAIAHKGIYSIEKFIEARRIMYWQVYLHKAVLSAENLLTQILKRAKELAKRGDDVFATPSFKRFLTSDFTVEDFRNDPSVLNDFSKLDDFDVLTCIKVWAEEAEPVLAELSKYLVNRKLLKVVFLDQPKSDAVMNVLLDELSSLKGITKDEASYFIFQDKITNNAYDPSKDRINIVYRDGTVKDLVDAADTLNISSLSKTVEKHFLCVPLEMRYRLNEDGA